MNRSQRLIRSIPDGGTLLAWVVATLALMLLVDAPDSCRADDDLTAARAELDAQFSRRLARLAAKCDELALREQAALTRRWVIPRHPGRQYLFRIPEPGSSPSLPSDAPRLVRQWNHNFTERRSKQADGLFELARRALRQHRPALAYQLVHEVLRENPDHDAARRILGHVEAGGEWHTPLAARRIRLGQAWHPEFGWLAKSDVKRYKAGQRLLAGRWVSAREEERHRGRIKNGWRIETEHYVVTTNHSLEAGVALGRTLDRLHSAWQQLFAGYDDADREQLALRFSGRPGRRRRQAKHEVVFFRNRREYVEHLKTVQPRIDITLGIYLDAARKAYFFAGDELADATLLHEATHQLLHENGNVSAGVGLASNFWIVEGIALYMESLTPHDGYDTVGGIEAARLQYARYRALSENFYMPLRELVGLGRRQLQQDERIGRLYSQAAGLTHFLMDSDDGHYRDDLMDYLKTVYQGRDNPHTLAQLTQTSYGQLDSQYRDFLGVRDGELARLRSLAHVTKLALGGTDVTDRGLTNLAGMGQLVWLDVSHTQVTDAGIGLLKNAVKLKQLSLDGTNVTDAALTTVGRFTKLEELDLSGTNITGAGLHRLAGLTELKVLWLTGTQIEDADLTHVIGFKKLEMLELSGTRVTREGWNQLRKALPELKAGI